MYEIVVEEKFDAAHCIRGYSGDCERLHGHTYRAQAILRTPELNGLGIAVDFRSIRTALKAVLESLDHAFINDLPEFSDKNPTAENLARYIYDKMRQKLACSLYRVTVWETDSSSASYWEE